MEKNPELIQDGEEEADDIQAQAVPLFLIHDGGGTNFTYHCLDSLGRPTYGIFNPHFHSGGHFEGGIYAMARLYASIIRRTCLEQDFPAERNSDGSVNILIGGWSMGGLLSLQIAKELTGGQDVRIIGLLMIDTMYTVIPPTVRLETLDNLHLSKSGNESLALQCMKEALRAILEWTLPVWEGEQAAQRPRMSLLRALNPIPTSSRDRVHFVDMYRNNRALGWDQYHVDMFTDIVDAKGDHFEIFSEGNIAEISKSMRRCLDTLEMLGPSVY